MTTRDRDMLIRLAITPDHTLNAPPTLGDDIYRAIIVTPQRRPLLALPRLAWPRLAWPHLSPASQALLLTVLLLLVLGALFVLSRPPVPQPRLTTYHGGPERTGVMPGPGPAGEPIIGWQVSRGGAIGVGMMPLVADGLAFIADDSGTLAALDETTGDERWSRYVGITVRSSPVLVDDLVVVGSSTGAVVAFHTIDGSETWRFTASGPVSASLAVVGNIVYVGTEDGQLHALEATSGDELWSMAVGGPITSGPAIAQGVIYVGTEGGRFSAINAGTQNVQWSAELGAGGVTTPAVFDGTVYVGRGFDAPEPPHDLVALDVADGSTRWVFASPSGRQVFVGALGPDLVYAVSEDSNIYALDPTSGDVIWAQPTGDRVGALAALVGETLYVSSTDWTVRAFDATTGAPRWSVEVEGEPSMPAVVNGRVYIGTTYGKVIAIAGSDDQP